ncbi:MAG: PaaI family thioesterase [Chthoniobacterales bacterium]
MTTPSVTDLPFNAFLGIEHGSDASELLRLPAAERYLNHLGTVHASAQLALAEASSGEFLLRHFGSADALVPVVRRLRAKFRQPANGAVTSTASVPSEALVRLSADIARKGRALVTVPVELHDSSGAHTLSAEVEWFIQRASPPGPMLNEAMRAAPPGSGA